jgi:tape measure domain-containing protein
MEVVEYLIKIATAGMESVQRIVSSVDRVNEKVNTAMTSFEKMMSVIKSNNMIEYVQRIGSGFQTLTGSSLDFEKQQANIRTLLNGDVKAADQLFSRISEYGKQTVYDRSGLVESQKTMMAFGLDADFAFERLKNIGDIALGDSGKMKSLSLAFAQATSTGKLMGQDLLQMINAGFNPLEIISQRTGKSIAKLKEEMSAGAISAGQVAQAFQWATEEGGRFYRGAETAGETVGGRIAKMQDTVDEWKISLFEATGGLTAYIGEFGKMAGEYANLIPVISGIGTVISFVTSKQKLLAVWTGITTVATKIWTGAQWLLNVALTANPVGLIIAGIVALIAVIAYVVYKTEGWGKTWENTVQFMSTLWDTFKAQMHLKWLQIQDFFLTGIDIIKVGWYKLQSLWDEDAANAGLQKLTEQRNERAQEIAAAKGKVDELNKTLADTKVWEVTWNSEKKLSDLFKDTGKALGITPPSGAGAGTGGVPGDIKTGAEAVATGGTRSTSITIDIGKMLETVNIYAQDFKDGTKNLEDKVIEAVTRALVTAQSLAR